MLIDQIMADTSSSFWLTEALQSALRRNPIDAALDAEMLAEALDEWLDRKLGVKPEDINDRK